MGLHVVREGRGQAVVLSHALGGDLSMWDGVVAALGPGYDIVRYDHRGHGRSPMPAGPCSIDTLADDAAALIDARFGGEPVHFVGLSMGGMVAQRLAANHPRLVAGIVVANAAASYGEADRQRWQARIDVVLSQGMEAIADGALERWFSPEFLRSGAAQQSVAALRSSLVASDPEAYASCCAAVAAIDLLKGNGRITCPALVIAGTADAATPPAMSRSIHESIPGARYAELPAAHLSAVELPRSFAELVAGFCAGAQAKALSSSPQA